MKANELRIGNLVSREDFGSGETRIESIIYLGEKAVISGPVKVVCEYDEIFPIPLDEEWLLKLGFKKQYIDYGRDILVFRQLQKDIVIIGFEYDYNGIIVNNINYVHQLQNLYFALTKKELIRIITNDQHR